MSSPLIDQLRPQRIAQTQLGSRTASVVERSPSSVLGMRGRTVQRVTTLVQSSQAVAILAPPWSSPRQFLEEVSGQLALSDPSIGSVQLEVGHLQGRTAAVQMSALLGGVWRLAHSGKLFRYATKTHMRSAERRARECQLYLGDRRSFRLMLAEAFDHFQQYGRGRMLLSLMGLDKIEAEVISDFGLAWGAARGRYPEGFRLEILGLANGESKWLQMPGGQTIHLVDYDSDETLERFDAHGVSARTGLAKWCGGIPGIVDAVLALNRAGEKLPQTLSIAEVGAYDRLSPMRKIAMQMRQSIEQFSLHAGFNTRLRHLLACTQDKECREVDLPLLHAGLIRRMDGAMISPTRQVVLRAPLVGQVISAVM